MTSTRFATLILLTACGTSSLLDIRSEPAGDNCAAGGSAISYGVDDDADGVLDAAEVDGTSYVCDGEAGADGATGAAGADGATGADGTDGADGANGTDGASGSMLVVTDEPAGENCASGGTRVDTGIDDDGDGALSGAEIDDTAYLCNATGTLVAVVAEAPGANCTFGGQRVETGADDNQDGVLDEGEVDETTYVCNGADGFDSLVDAVEEPVATEDCPGGGWRLDRGVDADRDGVLDAEEVDGSTYLCETPPAFATEGIFTAQPRAAVEAAGWQVCYQETYDVATTAAAVTTACSGDWVMLACTDDTADPDTFVVGAADHTSVVVPEVEDAAVSDAFHSLNGVSWYFTEGWSIGFFREGDGVSRNQADTSSGTFPEERLSWHTINDAGGYRCGSATSLNNNATYTKWVLVHD